MIKHDPGALARAALAAGGSPGAGEPTARAVLVFLWPEHRVRACVQRPSDPETQSLGEVESASDLADASRPPILKENARQRVLWSFNGRLWRTLTYMVVKAGPWGTVVHT